MVRITPKSDDYVRYDEGRGLPDPRVLDLAQRRGRIVAATAHGLASFSDSNGFQRLAPNFSDAALAGSHRGDTVWVGTRTRACSLRVPGEADLLQPDALRQSVAMQATVVDITWRADTLVALLQDRLLWRNPATGLFTLGPLLGNALGRLHTIVNGRAGLYLAGEQGVGFAQSQHPAASPVQGAGRGAWPGDRYRGRRHLPLGRHSAGSGALPPRPRRTMSNLGLGPGANSTASGASLLALGMLPGTSATTAPSFPMDRGDLVVSMDLAVEEIHFRRDWLTLEEIGWRAASAALSDLAAEGAEAVAVLTSVAVPSAATDEDLYALMAGIGAAAVAAGGVVSGGDLSAGERWVVNLTVIGRARRPVTRGGAMVGDGIWVTGALGGARAALEDWRAGRVPSPLARAAFAHPIPRIAAGVALADAGAHAMLDLSDGLGGDAEHLAAASGVSLEIDLDLLPIHPAVPDVAKAAALAPAMFAAVGGEDYELLVALPPRFRDEDAASFTQLVGLPLTRIGQVGQGSGTHFVLAGKPMALRGYDHFA